MVGEAFTGRAQVDILLRHIAEVLLDEPALELVARGKWFRQRNRDSCHIARQDLLAAEVPTVRHDVDSTMMVMMIATTPSLKAFNLSGDIVTSGLVGRAGRALVLARSSSAVTHVASPMRGVSSFPQATSGSEMHDACKHKGDMPMRVRARRRHW